MKLPPKANYKDRVDKLMESLRLEKAADTKIGGPLVKGVSGGERKRTSIGVELITDPNLIFLDEPTTGLDSFTASNVVEVLKALAESGRTVISTIHQPNSECFENFDQLMLMAQGKIIYMNDASKAVDYFKSIGYVCPSQTNPADFFMNTMSIEAYDDVDFEDADLVKRTKTMIENSYKEKIIDLHEKYENSEFKCDVDDIHPEAVNLKDEKQYHFRANIFLQFWLLLVRSMRETIRLPIAGYVRIISIFIMSIIVLLVFGQLDTDVQSIQSRTGLLFFFAVINIMTTTTNVVLIFPDERPVFLREQGGQLYSPTAYFFAKVMSEIPILIS